ncbi:MAG: LuxR C-terminal-related transcriptional regulator [Chloroflexus sp.]
MVPLVRTKLHPPEVQRTFLPRARLYERMRTALHSRLVLIAAPAGYGKTSLLIEWITEARSEWSHIAWLSLDPSDNDIHRLLMYLLAALDGIPVERRDRLRAMIDAEEMDAEQWVAELLNDLAEEASSTVIVLDDYQTISDSLIHRAITFLVDHLPPRCRLIISTRSDPPLPLARWRARGYMTELRSFDLAFTPEEAAAFLLETMELPLSREQIVALIESTEGWPAGLHLVALALRNRTDRSGLIDVSKTTNRYVVDYLIEDVFIHLPVHIQQFLLQTSILDRLCGPLCDAVLGVVESPVSPSSRQSYSQLILNQLERDNLFLVPLDAERVWYRYHHLFAEVLRDRLAAGSSAEDVAMLHRRAGAWYAAHGLLTEAINHALRARAIDDVVAILEPNGLSFISQVGETTLRRWLPEIPDATFERHPRLALLRAWLATADYQMDEAAHWITVAERALAEVASGAMTSLGAITNLQGELSAVRVRLATLRGDTEEVIRAGRQALALLQADNQALRIRVAKDLGYAWLAQRDLSRAEQAFSEAMANGINAGLPYIVAMATIDCVYTQMLRGAINQAINECRNTLDYLWRQRVPVQPGAGLPFIALTDLHSLRHEFAGALPALAEAESLIKSGSTTSYLHLLIASARIARARGDSSGALRIARQARFLARQRDVRWVLAVLDGLEAQLLIEQGELEAAAQLLNDQVVEPVEFRHLPVAAFYAREHITRARYEWRLASARATGDSAALRALATELAEVQPSEIWQTLSPIDAAVLRGLALDAAGDDPTPAIVTALNAAGSERIVAPFHQAGELLQMMLRHLAARQQLPPYGKYVLALLTDEEIPVATMTYLPRTSDLLPEPLSQREIEVLRLMAEGCSNHEIAERLMIALSTVKSHINNIFSKLGVASRTQAVARGRRLGLIT